jgi:hypothetical protein
MLSERPIPSFLSLSSRSNTMQAKIQTQVIESDLVLCESELQQRYDIADKIAAAYMLSNTFDSNKFDNPEYRKRFMFAVIINTTNSNGVKLADAFKGHKTVDGIPLSTNDALRKSQHITNLVINKLSGRTESAKVDCF